jgi:hypothetical protein
MDVLQGIRFRGNSTRNVEENQVNLPLLRNGKNQMMYSFIGFLKEKTGTIGFVIPNTNQKSDDYSHIKDNYRPSHGIMFMKKIRNPRLSRWWT